jgi:hypothetical protein
MIEDELDNIVPKKARKQTKPKGYSLKSTLTKAKPSKEETTKPKKAKVREPTPELEEESSLESIQVESEIGAADTSLEEEPSFEEPVKRGRGRPPKSLSATPQAPPRARSASAQPSVVKAKSTSTNTGVRGRKPKLSIVPETQVDLSVVEEDEVDEVEIAPKRQGSVIPPALKKSSYDQGKTNRVKELQSQAEKNYMQYKERVEKRFKGIPPYQRNNISNGRSRSESNGTTTSAKRHS